MSLCDICVALPLTVAHLRSTEVPFHNSLASLKASSESGCAFCSLCWSALARETNEDVLNLQLESQTPAPIQLYGEFEDFGSMRTSRYDSIGSYIQINCGEPVDNIPYITSAATGISALLNVFADTGAPAEGRILGRLCSAEPDPVSAQLSLARTWMSECCHCHETCQRRSSNFRPSRMLYVGDAEDRMPRLVVDEPSSEPFAALSYCWGRTTHQRLRLLMTNMEDLKGGIQVSEMTQTNREALEVVRRLGIKYVWIDALCIIQDSKEDWHQQSQIMAQIYDAAHLTLLAGSAADSSEGFLHPRKPGPRVAIPYSHNPLYAPYYHPDVANPAGVVYATLKRSADPGPIQSRAWCFQERALSNQMIVWGAEQLSFRCMVRNVFEDGGTEVETYRIGMGILQKHLAQDAAIDEALQHRAAVLREWYLLVQQYSSRDLWDPADIFAAMSGIAQHVERSLKCAYLAGIWEVDMIRGLLWSPGNLQSVAKFKPLIRPVTTNTTWGGKVGDTLRRAPSWSWAAPQGPVTYGSCYVARYDKVFLDSSRWRIRPADLGGRWSPQADTFNAARFDMSDCIIRVVGKLQAVVCSKLLLRDVWDISSLSILERKRHVVLVVKNGLKAGHILGVAFLDIDSEKEDEAWCLQVIDQRGVETRHFIDGLLLRRCAADATFARVGTFRLLDEDFFDERKEEETLTLI